MRYLLLILLFFLPLQATDYYICASGGSDVNNGQSLGACWSTFSHAWDVMGGGDTLFLGDGTYVQRIAPDITGSSGNEITVTAINDGAVVIDCQDSDNACVELTLGADYFTIQGIVVINTAADNGSVMALVYVGTDHNTIQRVSAYNVDKDGNSSVFWTMGSYNLLEDCVAGGYGRKMFLFFSSDNTVYRHNIMRRCFIAWQAWPGDASYDPGYWPWGDGGESYGESGLIFENNISYGMAPGPTPGLGSNNQQEPLIRIRAITAT